MQCVTSEKIKQMAPEVLSTAVDNFVDIISDQRDSA